MKTFYLITSFLFITQTSLSQTIVILDSITNEPIPYVAIKLTDSTGFYTNDLGVFNTGIIDDKNRFIDISSIGYETKQYKISKKDVDSIFLFPKIETLDEVKLYTGDYKTRTIGYKNKRKSMACHIDATTELAIHIKPSQNLNRNYINTIHIPIGKSKLISKGNDKWESVRPDFNSVFRLYIYDIKNGKPNENLLQNPLLIKCNQESNNTIDVNISHEKIELTENGIFIVIEMIGEVDEAGNVIDNRDPLPSFKYTNKKTKDFESKSFYKPIFSDYWITFDFDENLNKKNSRFNMALSLTLSEYEY